MTDTQAFEKAGNYRRQNYNKGYQEKTRAGNIKQRYMPNGKLKSFYKWRPDKQDDDGLGNNNDGYEPAIEEHIGTDKMTVEQKKKHVAEYRQVDPLLLSESDFSIITKENIFFKLMNDGFKLLLLER